MSHKTLIKLIKRVQFLVPRLINDESNGVRARNWANEFDSIRQDVLSGGFDWEVIAKSAGIQYDTNGSDLLA